jgi:hypothetical protein
VAADEALVLLLFLLLYLTAHSDAVRYVLWHFEDDKTLFDEDLRLRRLVHQ